MRFFLSMFVFVGMLLGVVYGYLHFSNQLTLARNGVLEIHRIVDNIFFTLLLVSVFTSILAASLFFTILSLKRIAGRIAYSMTKDIAFSKEEFRRFYELSPVPYLLIDAKGLITRPNKASLRFFKTAEEELLGKDFFSFLIDTEHPKKILRYKDSTTRHIPVEQKEIQVKLSDDEVRWVLLSIENLTSPDSGERQSMVTMVDIHEQKELERIKTEFLSLASHQLRTPLANLKWYIDFLLQRKKEQMSPEIQEYLQKMYRRNNDMIELVNTFLNLSRIEMGRVQVQREKIDMAQVVQSVLEELEPIAAEKHILVESNIPEHLIFETDERIVRIVFQNLLSNAIRYTKEGGRVFVRLQEMQNRLRFQVEDTGIGIPSEEQVSIFSKLYRATNAREVEANGNGIGLYICKELVEGLGGSIVFVSKVNEGTTFTVNL